MSFDEVRFPTRISFGSSGGPTRRTDIVTLASGKEERNAVWANSRRRYTATYGIKTLNDMHTVIEFFEARYGQLRGFRWKDPFDFKSCPPLDTISATDQIIATGDGNEEEFQLIKNYSSGGSSYSRKISKPVSGTVVVAVDGTAVSVDEVDTSTGLITLDSAPANGAVITAGYEFDVPVRFEQNELLVSLEGFAAGAVPDVSVLELLL